MLGEGSALLLPESFRFAGAPAVFPFAGMFLAPIIMPDERFSCSSRIALLLLPASGVLVAFPCLEPWLHHFIPVARRCGELVIVLSVYLGVPSVWYGVRYVRAKLMENCFPDWAIAARASDARSWRPWTWRQSRRRDDTAASAAASVSAAALDAAQVEIHTGTDRSERSERFMENPAFRGISDISAPEIE